MKVLLFEPNSHHYEILPGFAKYFIDLKWEVDILSHDHRDFGDEMFYCDFTVNRLYHHGADKFEMLRMILAKNKYDLLFITSFDYFENGNIVDLSRKLEELSIDIPYIGCCHDLNNLQLYNRTQLLKEGRIVTLSNYSLDGYQLTMINPLFFGNFTRNKEKNDICRIINIGISSNRNHIEQEVNRLPSIIPTIEVAFVGKMDIKKLKLSRIKRRFFYPICKWLKINPYCKEDYRPISLRTESAFSYLGKLSFEDMYSEIVKSDYIMIDVESDCAFFQTKTSGSKQLALGFNKPAILCRRVASAYGFNEKTAVIYEEGHLRDGILKAVSMSKKEYAKMCQELIELQKQIYEESKRNLLRFIDN